MTYLSKLHESIQGAASAEQRLELQAELAGALARYGKLDVATRQIAGLREANSAYAPAVTAWILIAEGQVAHFKSLAPQALSSFRSAHAISSTIGRKDIASVAGAWMAASEYVAGRVAVSAKHAVEAILQLGHTSSSSRSRAHLVIADCLSCAGLDKDASSHYAIARRCASDDRDISMQSVVLYNAAAFGVAGLTVQDCLGDVPSAKLRSVELQLESIANLDAGIGLASLDSMVPLLKAEFLTAAKRWEGAIDQYRVAMTNAIQQGQDRWIAMHLSGLAYCLAKCGQSQLALETANDAIERIDNCSDADNKAVTHNRLARTFALAGRSEALEKQHRAKAVEQFAEHSEQQGRMREELHSILEPIASSEGQKK